MQVFEEAGMITNGDEQIYVSTLYVRSTIHKLHLHIVHAVCIRSIWCSRCLSLLRALVSLWVRIRSVETNSQVRVIYCRSGWGPERTINMSKRCLRRPGRSQSQPSREPRRNHPSYISQESRTAALLPGPSEAHNAPPPLILAIVLLVMFSCSNTLSSL